MRQNITWHLVFSWWCWIRLWYTKLQHHVL